MEGEKKEGTRKGLGVREEERREKTGTGRDRARQTVQDRWTRVTAFHDFCFQVDYGY